jgi:hypothetical protein
MRSSIRPTIAALAAAGAACGAASAQLIGPSTLQSPYGVATSPGVVFKSIASNGFRSEASFDNPSKAYDEFYTNLDTGARDYRFGGTPDGLGYLDNGDGTFSTFVNHEFYNFVGDASVRKLKTNGTYMSEWRINKSDLSVVGGRDLAHTVNLWQGGAYVEYNGTTNIMPSFTGNIERFCSADLPAVTAFYNPATGSGTQTRFFMNGEESDGRESFGSYLGGKKNKGGVVPPGTVEDPIDRSAEVGRAFATAVSGAQAGTSWELPALGKWRWENNVPNPHPQEKTVIAGPDDVGDGNNYIYVGTKQSAGSDIEKAGLANGLVYAPSVPGLTGRNAITFSNAPRSPVPFTMVQVPDAASLTQDQFRNAAFAAGASDFGGVEDSVWDPANPNVNYFVVSGRNRGPGGVQGANDMPFIYRMTFDDIENPTAGGQVEVLLDGTTYNGEGKVLSRPDNITAVTNQAGSTMLVICEDNGATSQLWLFDTVTEQLMQVGVGDPARFLASGEFVTDFRQVGRTGDADMEFSGIVPAYDILGEGWFLLDVQVHHYLDDLGGAREIFEGGQLMAVYIPQAVYGIPTPGAMGLLGLAGLAAARRRRA